MTLQAQKPHIGSDEHARIRGAVRLMARRASFGSHRNVLKCKRSALVAVTLEAGWFVR